MLKQKLSNYKFLVCQLLDVCLRYFSMSTDTESTAVRYMTLTQLVRRFNHQKSLGINISTKDLKYELLEHGYTLEEFKLAQKSSLSSRL